MVLSGFPVQVLYSIFGKHWYYCMVLKQHMVGNDLVHVLYVKTHRMSVSSGRRGLHENKFKAMKDSYVLNTTDALY